jgi:hypothetical protein
MKRFGHDAFVILENGTVEAQRVTVRECHAEWQYFTVRQGLRLSGSTVLAGG